MEKLFRVFYGYVCICIKGEQLERFLNLCRSKGIFMQKICRGEEGQICGEISIKDFFRLRSVRKKTGVHIQINKKYGMPFFFWKNKKRKAFFAGIFLCMMVIFFLSARIWNIHIEGNTKYSTEEILEFLEKEEVMHGMLKKKINCSTLAASVRKKYPEFIWVSARIQGCRLILQVQEGEEEQEKKAVDIPCDLKAGQSGVIVQMITRAGIPVKKVGETCEKGELLVSGELHILNDSQEIVRYEYVHADADVYIQRKISYYKEFPLEYTEEISTGREKRGIAVRVGVWNLNLYTLPGSDWKLLQEEYPMQITENFFLPCSLKKIHLTEYKKQKNRYTKEQAEEFARKELVQYKKNLLKRQMQIEEVQISTKITETACISKGTLSVIEKTGVLQEINTQERENSYLKSNK